MEVIKWLDSHSGAITAIVGMITGTAAVVLAVITRRYVHLTREILEENRLMRLDAQKPEIAIYLRLYEADLHDTILSVENIGTGAAHDLQLKTDLSFRVDHFSLLENIGFIKHGIKYLPPGKIYECSMDIYNRFEELKQTPLKIAVTYQDSVNQEHNRCFCLDFGELDGLSRSSSALFKIHQTLRDINRSLDSMS